MFNASSREDYPAVGDWAAISEVNKEQAVIHKILPRETIIKRKYGGINKTQIIATNIDVAFIIESVDRDYNLNRFERYFAIAEDGGVQSAIILNKIDLISSEDLESRLSEIKNRFPHIKVISTSNTNPEGLNELARYMQKGKTYCFLGSSGVGKSSLINNLLGKNIIKTGEINLSSGRGKHITTNREMYFLKNKAIVIDNPGMREVGMAKTEKGISNFFEEITALAKGCKYADCSHVSEPGCKVLLSLKSGKLDNEKYSNYINLRKEAEFYEMNELEKREKNRQFGKFIKGAKKQLRDGFSCRLCCGAEVYLLMYTDLCLNICVF